MLDTRLIAERAAAASRQFLRTLVELPIEVVDKERALRACLGCSDSKKHKEGSLVSHSRAKLNPFGRRLLCERIAKGFPVRIAARMVGISHARAYIIWHRYLGEGEAAFELRSSRPHRSPGRTPELVMRRIERARRRRRWGPLRLSWELGLPRSTIYVVLRRLQLHRLRFFRPPRPVYRRYERPVPGDLVHIDTKKVGRVPEGGGKRFGPPRTGPGAGWEYVHVAVDDRSRVHYSERLGSERAADAGAFTAGRCASLPTTTSASAR